MKKLIILITVVLLVYSSCEKFADTVYRIRVRNNSSQTICAYADYILPDTSLAKLKPEKLKIIMSGEFKDIYDSEVGDIGFVRLKHEKISIFIISKETLDKYPWDTIRDKYMILKRYEITESDLKDQGSISYP